MRPDLFLAARLGCLSLILLAACAPPRRAALGTECELNSECDTPLICRLGFCRNECATSGDCSAGLSCVLTGASGDPHRFGACQLAAETDCALDSECPEGLVCRFRQCTNACNEDRDCPGGARCRVDVMGNACVDAATDPCTRDSECSSDEFCLDGRCRPQCFTDRDCRNDYWCDLAGGAGVCRPPPRPRLDAAIADASVDAPGLDAPGGDAPITSACGALLENVVSISASETHVCALVSAGTNAVYCWGQPASAVGHPTDPLLCATEVTALTGIGVSEVAVGGAHTCVRDGSNRVHCFGSNDSGQLGRTTGGFEDPMPQLVMPSTSAVALALGTFHTCASTGFSALCWGRNAFDQLGSTPAGTPLMTNMPIPSRFFGTSMTAGREHTCALDMASMPFCWGSDASGQLGLAGPVLAASVVDAGRAHTCALLLDNTVSCWGFNDFGQLGDGTTTPRGARVVVPGLTDVSQIAVSALNTCAVTGGEVFCWGWSYIRGNRSDGAAVTPITAPERVDFGGLPVDELETGHGFACIRSGGNVYCVGDNPGALGDGTMTSRRTAVPVGRVP